MGLFNRKPKEHLVVEECLVVGFDNVAPLADIEPRRRGSVMPVVGSFAYPEAWEKVTGGWQDDRQPVNDAVLVRVVPEPTNRKDPNAIVVTAAGMTLGYIPKTHQESMSEVLAQHGGTVQLLGLLECYRSSNPRQPEFNRYGLSLSLGKATRKRSET